MFLSPACTPPSAEAICAGDVVTSPELDCVLLGAVQVNHPDPLVSGNFAPFVGRWMHEIAAEAAKAEPLPSVGDVTNAQLNSPGEAWAIGIGRVALFEPFGSLA